MAVEDEKGDSEAVSKYFVEAMAVLEATNAGCVFLLVIAGDRGTGGITVARNIPGGPSSERIIGDVCKGLRAIPDSIEKGAKPLLIKVHFPKDEEPPVQ